MLTRALVFGCLALAACTRPAAPPPAVVCTPGSQQCTDVPNQKVQWELHCNDAGTEWLKVRYCPRCADGSCGVPNNPY